MNQTIIFIIELSILAIVALAGYVFIKIMMKSIYQKGYLQGREDEYNYQQEDRAKLIKDFCSSAVVKKEELEKLIKRSSRKKNTLTETITTTAK